MLMDLAQCDKIYHNLNVAVMVDINTAQSHDEDEAPQTV